MAAGAAAPRAPPGRRRRRARPAPPASAAGTGVFRAGPAGRCASPSERPRARRSATGQWSGRGGERGRESGEGEEEGDRMRVIGQNERRRLTGPPRLGEEVEPAGGERRELVGREGGIPEMDGRRPEPSPASPSPRHRRRGRIPACRPPCITVLRAYRSARGGP